MIVLNKDVKEASETANPYLEMFHRELQAYCTYKDWKETADDPVLEMALEEMMEDEFLHARFLRDYMIKHDMYSPDPANEHEIKYWKIHKRMYRS